MFLTVHRKAGQGDLQGFVIVLEDNFGNSQTNHSFENTTVRELETVRIVFKHTLPGNVVKITVAPLIRTAGGTQLGIPISEIFIGEDGTVGSGGSWSSPPPSFN